MANSKRIFIDTSAWIEYLISKERYHALVADCLDREAEAGSKFFTSDYVIDETLTRLITSDQFRVAKFFKEYVEKAEKNGEILILWTDRAVFAKAWHYFEKFKEHKLSFTDAAVVAFVKDLKIDEVLTLDKGFSKVGLTARP
ncbi:hypothetical protein A2630_04720 [Candidatus Woesebacteria bacterium RIFCSPHIGHO2_01_FULL_44_10]|uniref:Ribonuclease VapC n=1 Tax=Candidatus Woesebacteria bacterium RIFCSPLOWO2_01_FULL_44_14 TaxID=1802525 RepID=A0A1F8C056_9BACT|nr:MAG: hypothetical protein A2630_04720 [Candidatus Woesebacteria bacterium RIFCSPHIGHO2_01_FULL_44_10]OGM55845.1 MAG: hypothetical protein A3F62_05515 [Candidatus Woesebacteria bacterium RIFCSPHIGHO2_12_FULL_44_11]OGM69642.1 MAG: hypothetical protein A2975_00815 [Candidatus Woesebacteria bacterium RIFCSPLOWO2_01_FULL_44_14]